jgi:hypothetical protein
VLPVGFKAIVTRLDAGTLTELMRGLLQAEADRLGLPANAVVVSEALTEGDGGLDGRIDAVPEESQNIPEGLVGFQFKAYKAKTISPAELEEELVKPGPTRIVKDGGTYVLVWQADLNDKQRKKVETELLAEASKLSDDPRVEIWDASAIVALSEKHVAVVEGLELVEFGAVRALPELEDTLRMEERPYEADPQRTDAIVQIRGRASDDSEDAMVVTVSGLAGTGKTRLVAEALSVAEVRDRVLYADSAEGLQTFISRVVKDERTSGILVVDELDESDLQSIHGRFAATRGRWRLVAIVPQTTRRLRSSAARDVVLVPLAAEATRRLVEATSKLPEVKARWVADAAQGFPELAFRLSEELQLDPDLDLVQLAHLERPHDVLRRALPDQKLRDALKPVSLFTGLGVEGDLAYQLEEVAAAFGRDPAELLQIVQLELSRNRFVSAAGRYRLVSPTLVAIWLAVELIDETPELDKAISDLSGPVQEAFYRQLELFGPDASQLAPALERLLDQERFRDPPTFDEAAGRFLRASAAVVPSQVAKTIDQLLGAATHEELRSMPRRDLVWALQILLWWPETWEVAIRNLYVLARHETETWANNATASFRDAFTVYLSGSTVPFADRIRWLADLSATASEGELPLLGQAAARGLDRHHSRVMVGFRGGGQPDDWQPGTVRELRDARKASWQQLLAVLDRSAAAERAEFVEAVGRGIGTLTVEGLFSEADTQVRAREWTSGERAELRGDVQRLVRVGNIPDEVVASLTQLRAWLEGDSVEERITTTLATPVWELRDDRESLNDDPPILVELAQEIVSRETGTRDAVSIGHDTANEDTRFTFLRLVAREVGAEALASAARSQPFDVGAYAAALSVADEQGEGTWVDRTLADIAAGENVERLPLLATFVEVSDERLTPVLEAVDQGRAPANQLSRLRGGARFLTLSSDLIERLLQALASAGALESALGMLLQVVEAAEATEIPAWARKLGDELARQAMVSDSSDIMLEYYVKELVSRGLFDPPHLADLWDLRMRSRDGLVEELDQVLTERTVADAPEEMLGRVIALIRDEASGDSSFSLFASRDLALLSRMAQVLDVDAVWEALEPLTEHEFRLAIHHMRWSGDVPDALVARFLVSPRLAGYESEAFTTFYNTLGIVSGDYWRALVRERDRARSWRAALSDSQAKQWADELVRRYEHDIEQQRTRDEEENFRLGG